MQSAREYGRMNIPIKIAMFRRRERATRKAFGCARERSCEHVDNDDDDDDAVVSVFIWHAVDVGFAHVWRIVIVYIVGVLRRRDE